MDITAQSQHDQDSTLRVTQKEITMLINFKKVFAHLLLCGYTAPKKSDY